MDSTGSTRKQTTAKKVPLSDIKPGMVLARDVVTSEGFILLAKDTLINPAILDRLAGKGINSVYIKEVVVTVDRAGDIKPEKILSKLLEQHQKAPELSSVTERKDFSSFKNEYDKKLDTAEEWLLSISKGAAVDVDELYAITYATFSKLKAKSDVLTYMSFLGEHPEHMTSHSYNVSLLCNMFAHWVKMDETDTKNLTVAGLLHDVGQFNLPPDVLYKKGKLTDEEFELVKTHPGLGYNILEKQDIAEDIKLAALMHHERFDGSGYPNRIKGGKINRFAGIIAICDTYDAMTANRAHRGRISPFTVIKNFEFDGYNKFDTPYLLTFLQNIAYIYFGSWVKLTDGIEGEIVYIHQNNLSRPVIRVGDELIDLQKTPEVSIASVL